MNAHTNIQIIEQNGKPAFAVLPWNEYESMLSSVQRKEKLRSGVPQKVMELTLSHDLSVIAAWREYLGLSQSEVAARAGMKQPALSRIEKETSKPKPTTIKRLADAMGLNVEQLCM